MNDDAFVALIYLAVFAFILALAGAIAAAIDHFKG